MLETKTVYETVQKGKSSTPETKTVYEFVQKEKSETQIEKQKDEVNYLGQTNFPKIVELDPPNEAKDVDPNREHITVTFDRPMRGGYSWVDKGKRPPIEKIEWIDNKQCRAWVKLEPNKEYGVWLNFGPNTSKFRSAEGISADRIYWTFRTQSNPPAQEKNPINSVNPQPKSEQYKETLKTVISVDIDKSPDGNTLTVQYAVIAICEKAGVPYQWEKSKELASPECKQFIASVHIKDMPAEEAIMGILSPVGLKFEVDGNGLYLCK